MLVYLIPYVLLIVLTSAYSKIYEIKVPNKMHFFLMLLPAILVVVLRGDVGTDTLNYLQHFEQLHESGISTQIFEPGFEILTRFMVYCGLSPRACVALIGFLTILLFIASFSKTKETILLFALIVFPSYFYDMTMNGIRYGLSFAIAALAIKYLYEKKTSRFVIISLLAISIQYSSLLIIFVYSISKLKIKYIAVIVVMLLATYPLYSGMLEYLFLKQEAYKESVTPSLLSGIGPMAMFLCLYVLYLVSVEKQKASTLVHIIFMFELFSFYMGRTSYAGLRLQSLFVFALVLFIVYEYDAIKYKDLYKKALLFLGILSFGLWLKNYVGDVEVTDAPFIPYKFFWSA
jgi:hypothetical protein